MKIYDKAEWHIDGGENKQEVLKKFLLIFNYLKINNMLTLDGLEIIDDLGIDSTVSIHEKLVTESGQQFLDKNYDSLLKLSSDELEEELKRNKAIKNLM